MLGEVVIAYHTESSWHLPGDWRKYEITQLKFEGSKTVLMYPYVGQNSLEPGVSLCELSVLLQSRKMWTHIQAWSWRINIYHIFWYIINSVLYIQLYIRYVFEVPYKRITRQEI